MPRKIRVKVKPWAKKPRKISIKKKSTSRNFFEKHRERIKIQRKKKAKV